MQSIEQALPQNRYLIIAGRISAAEWQRIVETVNSALIENRPSRAISEVEIERTMINKPLLATQLPIYSTDVTRTSLLNILGIRYSILMTPVSQLRQKPYLVLACISSVVC